MEILWAVRGANTARLPSGLTQFRLNYIKLTLSKSGECHPCADTELDGDAFCKIYVRYLAGGVGGLQMAVFERGHLQI